MSRMLPRSTLAAAVAVSACFSEGVGSESGATNQGTGSESSSVSSAEVSSASVESGDADTTTGGVPVSLLPCPQCWSGWCAGEPDRCALGVFVTRATFFGSIGSQAAGDMSCQLEADAPQFRAWLARDGADDSAPAPAHVGLADDRAYVLRGDDGVVVVSSGAALLDGALLHAIDRHADGQVAPSGAARPPGLACAFPGYPVWTGTSLGVGEDASACVAWSCGDDGLCLDDLGAVGDASAVGLEWTAACEDECSKQAALYCFESP